MERMAPSPVTQERGLSFAARAAGVRAGAPVFRVSWGITGGMAGVGRALIFCGVALIAAGAGALLWARWGLPTRLPGDLVFRRGPVTLFLPLGASILLSLLLTLLLNLFVRRR